MPIEKCPASIEGPGHYAFQPGGQSVGKLAHGLLEIRRELTLAVEVPQREPLVKMMGCQTINFEMRACEPAPILGRPTSLQCPKLGDLNEVRFPILNVSIKNGS